MTVPRNLPAAAGLANTRQARGDGSVGGRVRAATPIRGAATSAPGFGGGGGGVQRVGELIALYGVVTVPAGGGPVLGMADRIQSQHGFISQAGASDPVKLPATGSWLLEADVRFTDGYRGGTTVQVTLDGTAVPTPWPASGPWARWVDQQAFAGNAGQVVELEVACADGQAHRAQVTVRLTMVERLRTFAVPPRTPGGVQEVLLAVGDASHPASARMADELAQFGYTVTTVDTGAVTFPAATGFELIVVNRPGNAGGVEGPFLTWLEGAMSAGVPMLLDPTVAGTSGSPQPSYLENVGLTGAGHLFTYTDSNEPVWSSLQSHPVTVGVDPAAAFYQDASYTCALAAGGTHVGAELGRVDGLVAAAAVETDTALVGGGTTGGRIVWSTTFYLAISSTAPGTQYTAEGRQFFTQAVEWVVDAPPPAPPPAGTWVLTDTPTTTVEASTAEFEIGWTFNCPNIPFDALGARVWLPVGGLALTINLWDNNTQALLQSVTTTSVANGWAEATFATPVGLVVNSTGYVVSFGKPAGPQWVSAPGTDKIEPDIQQTQQRTGTIGTFPTSATGSSRFHGLVDLRVSPT